MRSNLGFRLAMLALIVAIAALAWHWGIGDRLDFARLKSGQAAIAASVAAHPAQAASAVFMLYVLVAAFALPAATLLTLAVGAVFPFLEALLLVSFASTIGATLAAAGARGLLRGPLERRYGQRLSAFDAAIGRDGAFYLLSLRLVPFVPFFVVNVLAGLSSLRLRTFYVVSQFGMLPATAAYVFAGSRLAALRSPRDAISPPVVAALALAALVPLAARGLLAVARHRRAFAGFDRPRAFDFDIMVIGAGSAGLVAAYLGSAAGAKVALVERERMGGDCLNTGCVPSKALLHSASVAQGARTARTAGVTCGAVDVDFAAVMERVQAVIRRIEPHDSVARYTALGVVVIRGNATLRGPWQVDVDGAVRTARAIVIATGAQPTVPPIDGLDDVEFLTSDTLWSLRERPGRLVVLGGGPIGCELAQAFARLGSKVTVVEREGGLLSREDKDAASLLRTALEAEDVDVRTSHEAKRVEAVDGVQGVLVCTHANEEVRLPFDRLLVALGRTPRTHGLGLDALGIDTVKPGVIETNGFLQTSMPSIFVAGDVAGPYQFTHVAAHQAWYAVANALLAPWWRLRADYRVIPWTTFTDPEIARVGLTEADAASRGLEVEIVRYELDDLDRAIADDAARGFVKIVLAKGTDRILGATIAGARASELLAELTLAMRHGLGLGKVLGTVHAYPTYAEANRLAAGAWKRDHVPQRLLRLATRYFAWRRGAR